LEDDILSIHIEKIWQHIIIDLKFDVNKGLKYSAFQREGTDGKQEFIVDEFQQVKDDIWVPKKAHTETPKDDKKIETFIEVLKVKVNDEINPSLYKNFPWDDPKYNTKYGIKWDDNQMRRNSRIQFKDHPPSYFTSFFGLSLEKAYQLYLNIN
jgi:hypothetical protein